MTGAGDGAGSNRGSHVGHHHCARHPCRHLRGLLLTMSLRHRLPPHHEDDATRDLIKIATGMMATLVALILGLLVNSAKTTFDTATAEVTQSGAQIITLDRMLRNFGPEAQPVRELLRSHLAGNIARIWPGRVGHGGIVNRDDSSALDQVGRQSASCRRRIGYRRTCRRKRSTRRGNLPGAAGCCSSRCRIRCRRCF